MGLLIKGGRQQTAGQAARAGQGRAGAGRAGGKVLLWPYNTASRSKTASICEHQEQRPRAGLPPQFRVDFTRANLS
jgi:hypothetical protein